MTQVQAPPTSSMPAEADRWGRWVAFGALMLGVNGLVNVFQGLVALFNEGYFRVLHGGDVLLIDYKAWGVVNIIWGLVLAGAGFGLISGRAWTRWAAIAVCAIGILLQVGFLAAFPVWSVLIIAFDVVVIFALTVHWDEASQSLAA